MPKPHEILGVEPNATRDEVRAAFRRCAAAHHPDRGGSTEVFQRLVDAQTSMLAKLDQKGVFDDIFTDFAKRFHAA